MFGGSSRFSKDSWSDHTIEYVAGYIWGQTFYALTRRTSAKVASCQPRVYADLLKDEDSNITQQACGKSQYSKCPRSRLHQW